MVTSQYVPVGPLRHPLVGLTISFLVVTLNGLGIRGQGDVLL